jgi:hypothetical protein
LGRPGVILGTPIGAIVVAHSERLALAIHLFDMIETLCPEFSIIPAALARFLSPVREDASQFSLAVLVEGHTINVAFVAELGEFSHGLQEVVIGVKWISVRETLIPLLLSEKLLDSFDIGCILVHVGNIAVITLR